MEFYKHPDTGVIYKDGEVFYDPQIDTWEDEGGASTKEYKWGGTPNFNPAELIKYVWRSLKGE